jgi:hypothetical protein
VRQLRDKKNEDLQGKTWSGAMPLQAGSLSLFRFHQWQFNGKDASLT